MPTREELDQQIEDSLSRYPNVPGTVVRRLMGVESGGRQDAVSPKGARSLMQIMPGTARDYNIDVNDWRSALDGGIHILSDNIARAQQGGGGIPDTSDGIMRTADYVQRIAGDQPRDVQLGVAAYHAGPGRVARTQQDALPSNVDGPAAPRRISAAATAPRGDGRPVARGWEDASVVSPITARPQAPSDTGIASDTWHALGSGFDQAAVAVREGVRQIFGDGLVSAIDDLDARVHGLESGEDYLAKESERTQKAMSPAMQEALQKEWVSEDADGNMSFGPAWTDWRSYYGGLLQSLPSEALTMVPAFRIARGAEALTKAGVMRAAAARGASKEAAEKLAEKKGADALARTATVAGGILEGGFQAGQSADEVRNDILKMPDDVLDTSAAFNALVGQYGGDRDAARRQLANDAATQAYVTAGVATAMFGGQGDRILARLVSGKIKGSALKRGLAAGTGEAFAEEFPQSYLSQVAQNVAEQRADASIPTTKGAMNQAVGGAVLGFAQGGAMGAAFGHESEARTPAPGAAPSAEPPTPPTPPGRPRNRPLARKALRRRRRTSAARATASRSPTRPPRTARCVPGACCARMRS